jgi:hypothetical protein
MAPDRANAGVNGRQTGVMQRLFALFLGSSIVCSRVRFLAFLRQKIMEAGFLFMQK